MPSILKLLHPIYPPVQQNGSAASTVQELQSGQTWASRHPFLNVAITPIECSVICSKELAEDCIAPALSRDSGRDCALISSEDYIAISVEGEGLEAGQRVLELTSPLAMAGM